MRGPNDRDDVGGLAGHLGRDLYVGTDGFVRDNASDTIASNQGYESDMSRGASGGCGQDADSVSSSSSSGDRD